MHLPLCSKSVSFCLIIADDHIVENGAALDLPQVEADEAKLGIAVDLVIMLVLRVVNLLDLPEALVCWVGDALDGPLTLVVWIVLHWGLPLAILLIIPIIGLLSLRIDNALLSDPFIWFLVLRVIDLLWLEDFPVVCDGAFVDLLLIDLHPDSVVRLEDQSVQVGSAVIILLVLEVSLLQHILTIVVNDEVGSLGVAAFVRSKHNVVSSWVAKLGLVFHLWANLDIATSTLDVLLILGLILDVELLPFVAERRESSGRAEELGVLCGLHSVVFLLILEPLARIRLPFPLGALALLPSTLHPSALPVAVKSFWEVDLAGSQRQ